MEKWEHGINRIKMSEPIGLTEVLNPSTLIKNLMKMFFTKFQWPQPRSETSIIHLSFPRILAIVIVFFIIGYLLFKLS